MTISSLQNQPAIETFVTAVLLTGDPGRAEVAMLEWIESIDCERDATDRLIDYAIRHARQEHERRLGQADDTGAEWLPAELRRVLLLPKEQRHCFVLRLLMGLPRERCAALLGVDTAWIDDMTATAAIEHALLIAREEDAGLKSEEFSHAQTEPRLVFASTPCSGRPGMVRGRCRAA